MTVSGVHLMRVGNYTEVHVERDGEWHLIIREPYDANFSHIAEESVIYGRVKTEKLCDCPGIYPFMGGPGHHKDCPARIS